jgi:hypothetical protein
MTITEPEGEDVSELVAVAAPPSDIAFLRSVAKRVADALYYGRLGPIGIDGSVSPGLTHDDYDRLRALAKRMEIESLQARLATLAEERT